MSPIFFKIYEIELHEGGFSFGTAFIYFLGKPYQKKKKKRKKIKCHLNSVLLCK